MPKHVRLPLMPLIVAAPFIFASAQAVPIGTDTAAAPVQAPASQRLSKKHIKQQRELAKQCAKLSAGKIRKASKRAMYEARCASPTGGTPPAAGSGAEAVFHEDQGHDTSGNSNTAGGNSGTDGDPGGGPAEAYLEESLDLPRSRPAPLDGYYDGPSGHYPQSPVVVAEAPTSVPEPGSLALLGLGLVGLGMARRRAR